MNVLKILFACTLCFSGFPCCEAMSSVAMHFTPSQKKIFFQELPEIQRRITACISKDSVAVCNEDLFKLRCEVINSTKDMMISELLAEYIDKIKLYVILGYKKEELEDTMKKDLKSGSMKAQNQTN